MFVKGASWCFSFIVGLLYFPSPNSYWCSYFFYFFSFILLLLIHSKSEGQWGWKYKKIVNAVISEYCWYDELRPELGTKKGELVYLGTLVARILLFQASVRSKYCCLVESNNHNNLPEELKEFQVKKFDFQNKSAVSGWYSCCCVELGQPRPCLCWIAYWIRKVFRCCWSDPCRLLVCY